MTPSQALELADYRRRVAGMYATVRAAGVTADPADIQRQWIAERTELFRTHPQSALDEDARTRFSGLDFWPYDPRYRVVTKLLPAEHAVVSIPHSSDGTTQFVRVGRVDFSLLGRDLSLGVFWLDAYGGGLFLPFGDATNGTTTYGGGRYLLDTVKGADLGGPSGGIVLDFNYAYHPSCVYSSRWSCPLAPAGNHLPVPVEAGERLMQATPRRVG